MGLRAELAREGFRTAALVVFTEVIGAAKLILRITGALPRLARSEVILLYNGGGFGHSVLAPDIWRRLNPGKRCAVLFHMRRARYNTRLPDVWTDVDLIMLDTQVILKLPGGHVFKRDTISAGRLFHAAVPTVLKWLMRGRHILTARQMISQALPRAVDEAEFAIDLPTAMESRNWLPQYLRLKYNEKREPPIINPVLRFEIARDIDAVSAPAQRTACVYLRRKGTAGSKDDEAVRSGSPLRECSAMLSLLRERGYRVLLVGDVTDDMLAEAGMSDLVVTATRAGVDNELFYLYAATMADIFIGEAGGGSWLPGLAEIPSLIINMYPYDTALPGALHYYKVVRDTTGKQVDVRALLRGQKVLIASDIHILDNSAQDLVDAVTDFLDRYPVYPSSGIDATQIAQLPARHWCASARAQISPAWWSVYASDISATDDNSIRIEAEKST